MDRMYVGTDGSRSIYDPSPRMLPFIKGQDPSYRIESVQHPKDYVTKHQALRAPVPGITKDELYTLDTNKIIKLLEASAKATIPRGNSEITFLDLVEEVAFRYLNPCVLCSHRCRVNRFAERGLCGVGYKAHLCELFLHIGEEAPLTTAIIANLVGCGMRCVYCIAHEFREPDQFPELNMTELLQNITDLTKSWPVPNTLEFGMGCTENLPWVIKILNMLPPELNLPVVFNTHMYLLPEVLFIIGKVADIWLPDFRYYNDECSYRLSGVKDYRKTAEGAMRAVAETDTRIICRVLVLPGHYKCCHEPTIKFLSQFRDRIFVSVLGQYIPEHDAYKHADINSRPTRAEVKAVGDLCERHELRDVNKQPEGFWK